MSKDIISDKDEFVKLILANIEYNSSSSQRAKEYLDSEGINVAKVLTSGMRRVDGLLKKYGHNQVSKAEGKDETFRAWNHISVKQLIQETGNPDPVDAIKTRARDLVLKAFEMGWVGPPYSPIEMAKFLNIDVIPNDTVVDARTIPLKSSKNKFQIQYNPFQRNTRINFSVAHEIAHTLFSDCAQAVRNREEAPLENRELEQLCNAAAAEIQLPYAIFSNDANSAEPSMNGLIELAKKYNASLESVFLRYTEVIDKPCAIMIGIFHNDKIVIDYYKTSREFPIDLPPRIEIPEESPVYECTSPGWTSRELNADWDIFEGHHFNVFAAGISSYRRDNKPRVGILVLPTTPKTESIEKGKILLEFGDATKPHGKGKKMIAQIVNTAAALGRGFGYSLTKNYPVVKSALDTWKADKEHFRLGETNLVKVNSETYVFQMLAQKGIFPKGDEIPLRYNELRKCLIDLRESSLELGCSVHMPAIGAGQARGDWDIIIGMIHDELVNYDIKVNIYLLPGRPVAKSRSSNLTLFKEESTWENGKLF